MHKEKKDKHFLNKPTYPGGPKALKAFITENIQHPAEAIAAKVEGFVSLKYSIDPKGNVIDVRIVSGLSHGCNEEAIRLVKLLKFSEAKNRGVRAIFHKDLTIHFRMPKEPATIKIPITQPTAKVVQPQQAEQEIVYVVSLSKQKLPMEEEPQQSQSGGSYHYTINIG